MFWGKQSGKCAENSCSHRWPLAAGGEPNLVLHLSHLEVTVCESTSTPLHGLSTPTQVVNRKKSVNGGWAANSPGVAAAWGTPQACGIMWGPPEGSAVKVSTVSSRQPSTIPVIEIGPAGEGVGTVEGAQPALAGPEGLPARRRGQRLTLCKETADLLFTGKLSKNGRVPQHTPRAEGTAREGLPCGRPPWSQCSLTARGGGAHHALVCPSCQELRSWRDGRAQAEGHQGLACLSLKGSARDFPFLGAMGVSLYCLGCSQTPGLN